ncbi:Uncharacterized protein SCF082_LOCUS9672, partial [Durusdinium trenchii]
VTIASMLLAEVVGLVLLFWMRRGKASDFHMDLGMGLMLMCIAVTCSPRVLHARLIQMAVISAGIVRISLLPLATTFLSAASSNILLSLAIRLRLGMQLMLSPGGDKLVEWYEQLAILELVILVLCLCLWQTLQMAMGMNADLQLETEDLRAEGSACASLLSTVCDAHFFLDAQLRFERDEKRGLSSILVETNAPAGTPFVNFLAQVEDKERFTNVARQAMLDQSTLAQVMHCGIRDGIGNVVPVQVFHIALFDSFLSSRHLVGLREFGDANHWGERDEVPELRWSKWSGYSRRASDQSSDSESDHSSLESSSSIDLDNDNKECRLVFEPIDMEVLSATEFLIECVGRTVAEGLTFMDLVHNDEKNNCRAEIMEHVNEFMATDLETTQFVISFQMLLRFGTCYTTWRCRLAKVEEGQKLVSHAQMIRMKKPRKGSKASRTSKKSQRTTSDHGEDSHSGQLRPTLYGKGKGLSSTPRRDSL